MTQVVAHVKDVQMMTGAWLTTDGILVRFADEQEGLIPLEELKLKPKEIRLPSPYVMEVILQDGRVEELPWDYLRAFIDPTHRAQAEAEGRRGRRLFGERLERLRGEAGLSQEALAAKAGISRVTIARLEAGEQDPHYETLLALAQGLGMPLEKLLVDNSG